LYTPCVLGLRPPALFNEFLLIKKKHYLHRANLDLIGIKAWLRLIELSISTLIAYLLVKR
jgi:hypothetical protein